MKKRLTILLTLLMFVLLLGANTNKVSAADYSNVGVAVGDTAVYSVSMTSSEVTSLHLLVHGVVGTDVTLNLTWYYPNGTVQSTHQIPGDISIGENYIWIYLVASGLQANDPPTSVASYYINSTGPAVMAGAIRMVNQIALPSGTLFMIYDVVSGLVLQCNIVFFMSWMNLTMIDTSFGNPLFRITTIGIIVGVVVVLIVAAVYLRGKSKKPRKRRKKKK